MRIRDIVLYSFYIFVAFPIRIPPYFFSLGRRTDFFRNCTNHLTCALIYTFSNIPSLSLQKTKTTTAEIKMAKDIFLSYGKTQVLFPKMEYLKCDKIIYSYLGYLFGHARSLSSSCSEFPFSGYKILEQVFHLNV